MGKHERYRQPPSASFGMVFDALVAGPWLSGWGPAMRNVCSISGCGKSYSYPRELRVPKAGTKARRIWDGCIVEMERLGWRQGDPNVRGRLTSARFIFYRLVAEGVIPKSYSGTRTPAQDVSDRLRDLREMGVFPPGAIVDEGRGVEDYTGWGDLREGAQDAVGKVQLDPWDDGTDFCIPHLWVESGSLLTILRPLAFRFRVPITAARGQASLSLCWEVARLTPDGSTVIYLGDLDLSGGHIESSFVERVEALVNIALKPERLAITHEQVIEHNLTVMSKYDKRTKSRHDAVETEALGQDIIEQLVSGRLSELLRTRTSFGSISDFEEHEEAKRGEMMNDLFGGGS